MISYEDVETAFDGSDYMVAQSRWLAPAKAQPGFTLDKGELMFKRSAAPDKKPPGPMTAKAVFRNRTDAGRLPESVVHKHW
jgi:hypothetical protein